MGGSQYRGGKYGGKGKAIHFIVIAQDSSGMWAIREYDTYSKSEAYHQAKDNEDYDKTKLRNVITAEKFNSITAINANTINSMSKTQMQSVAKQVDEKTRRSKKQ